MAGQMKIGEMFYDVVANTGPALRNLDKFKARAEAVGQKMQSVGRKMTMGLTLPILAVAAASVKAASDAEEMESMFDAVFKKQSASVRKWAAEHADAVNRSRYDLMEYAASLQDTFVPMGFARDEAAEFSKQMVELAVDVASFKNQLEPDVIRDFQSAIVGNHETVRKYGIIITQAALDQELLNMGWADGANKATEQMKVQARLNLIMKGTTDAQGDAARTSESFANQMKGLKGDLKEVSIELGKVLIPELKNLIKDGKPVLDWLKDLTPAQREWMVKIGLTAAAIPPLLIMLGRLTTAFATLRTTAAGAWIAVAGPYALVGAGVVAGGAAISLGLQEQERQLKKGARRAGEVLAGERPIPYRPGTQFIGPPRAKVEPAPELPWGTPSTRAEKIEARRLFEERQTAPDRLTGISSQVRQALGLFSGAVAPMNTELKMANELITDMGNALSYSSGEFQEIQFPLAYFRDRLREDQLATLGFAGAHKLTREELRNMVTEMASNIAMLSEFGDVNKEQVEVLDKWLVDLTALSNGLTNTITMQEKWTKGIEKTTEALSALDQLEADFSSPEAMALAVKIYEEMLQKRAQAEQEVADQHTRLVAPDDACRLFAAAQLTVIDNVIVQQRRRVHELHGRCNANLPIATVIA